VLSILLDLRDSQRAAERKAELMLWGMLPFDELDCAEAECGSGWRADAARAGGGDSAWETALLVLLVSV
jgi:hypothetical protein